MVLIQDPSSGTSIHAVQHTSTVQIKTVYMFRKAGISLLCSTLLQSVRLRKASLVLPLRQLQYWSELII